MIYVSLPDNKDHVLPFYLSMEEYVARKLKAADYFFMWQVEPTVIFGRNQLIENEVNLEFCHRKGIKTFRRKSGGGCVYADKSNIMFSYITPRENVSTTFKKYIDMVVNMLHKLGINASTTGRNDIMIGNRKVSGNAFYHIPGRSIVHGTMLYDTNIENMVGSITPDNEKLLSKGVSSVRQHITLLKDHITLTIEEFKTFAKQDLCNEEITLTPDDIKEIESIEQQYLRPEFIYGNNPRYTIIKKGRIEGVGVIEIRMEMKDDVIKDLQLMGDYFQLGDIDDIIKPLIGRHLNEEELRKSLPETRNIIMNLEQDALIKLMI
jgi:lipoate-protein ligase A